MKDLSLFIQTTTLDVGAIADFHRRLICILQGRELEPFSAENPRSEKNAADCRLTPRIRAVQSSISLKRHAKLVEVNRGWLVEVRLKLENKSLRGLPADVRPL